jgi:hypothetical protein
MFDKFVLPELVAQAQDILETQGEQGIHDYQSSSGWCACMGPRPGERLCPCQQSDALYTNMVEVVSEIDPELARRVMIRRLVAALPG